MIIMNVKGMMTMMLMEVLLAGCQQRKLLVLPDIRVELCGF